MTNAHRHKGAVLFALIFFLGYMTGWVYEHHGWWWALLMTVANSVAISVAQALLEWKLL